MRSKEVVDNFRLLWTRLVISIFILIEQQKKNEQILKQQT